MQSKYFGSIHICYLSLCILNSLITRGTTERYSGIMKLCPPGGESFTTVWHLACAIRKKRSLRSQDERIWKRWKSFRPLSMTEMMDYCCNYGCTIRDLLPYCDPFGGWDS